MKKISLFTVLFFICFYGIKLTTVNAQLSTVKENVISAIKLNDKTAESIRNLNLHANSKSTESRWYNYATAMQNYIFPNGNDNYWLVALFPDTTVRLRYSGNIIKPSTHGFTVILDPTAEVFYDENQLLNMGLPRLNKFKIDSVGLMFRYRRHDPNPAIVDTLFIEMISNLRVPKFKLYPMADKFGFDTVTFIGMSVSQKNLSYVKPDFKTEVITRKILLTQEIADDTLSNGFNYIALPSSQTNYYNTFVAATFRFKPGYDWIPYQSILNEELNEFNFISFEENGLETYPNYYPENYNMSQIIHTVSLKPGNQWYKLYVPSVAFPTAFKLENHWVDFKISCNNVGINEVDNKYGNLYQNYPNPADMFTNISFRLSNSSDVKLLITDITGKIVMQNNIGNKSAGYHNIKINTDNIKSGMYYYTLVTDNLILTKKMLVNN